MSKRFLLPLLLLAALSLQAQEELPTPEESKREEAFLDGNREKLLGNWEKAAAKFKEVLEGDPKNDAASYELARVYEALKETDKAIAAGKNAVEWNPTNPWYKYYLAELYQKVDKDKAAADLYAQLVKADPRNEGYYFKWAYYLVRASQPAEAIKVYDQLEKLIGVNEETTRHKQTLYLGMGEYKKAGKEVQDLIARFPNNVEYRHLLATFYDQTGDKAKATATYQEILKLAPNDARAQIALADDNKGTDDIKFLNSLRPVFEDPATNIDTKIKEIIPYVARLAENGDKSLGNSLLALTSLLETVHPNSPKAHSVLGDVLYHSGNHGEALGHYLQCLALDKNVWAVWEQVLFIYFDNKDYTNLTKTSEQALDLFPNQATAHYFNGLGYNGLHQPNDALPPLQQALIMSAKNPSLRFNVLRETAEAHYQLKKYAQAEKPLGEALLLNAKDPAVLERMGDVQFQLGKQTEALQFWQKAQEAGSKSAVLQRKVLEGKLVE
ncbi:MAG: tetratricopeptide repeat protein [Saprospiraceae bacterium]|jgi:tetratricopeptide (TPR) repeat protein|nr:tetratricopeptide repeat protein [Saprospiraceae bacterium]